MAHSLIHTIQRMTYPDGEVVSYRYNKGGMLQSIIGEKNGISYPYIGNILYDEFELKKKKEYGNSTHTEYEYDDLQRLVHLESRTLQGEWMQDIVYDYDGVGNITKITNVAGALANGLGGVYNNEYTYDNLYRLNSASGEWQGVETLNFGVEMGYHKNGRVDKKKVAANTVTPDGHSDINYQRGYFYENSSQPNTLTRIEEQEWMSPNGNSGGSGGGHVIGIAPVTPYTPPVTYEHEFEWDASGNMTYHHHEGENSSYERYLCWDEVNRLQGVVDDTHQSFYQYDANGERTYKLTTREQAQMVNGHWYYYTVMDNPTLYVSPYLVVTRQGYTKHYYAESERIASKIGMGGLTDICQCLCPDMTLQSGNQGGDSMNQLPYELADLTDCEGPEECFYDKLSLNNNHFERVMRECLESNPNVEPNTLNEALYSFRENMEEYEPDCYWYHPDHLGSSSWITYTDGEAVQHLHYLPWGENFVDQQNTSFSSMYTFSAKEKDAETGYSYFGSRYYSSDLSIWLSVDPMSDKYPSLSSYTYCANNPIKLVDPNGEELWKPEITGTGDIRLLSEEGDSYQSLTHFLGGKSGIFSKRQIDKMWKNRDEKGNVTLSKNIFSKAIKKAMKLNYPSEEDIMKYKNWAAAERAGYTKNYNCIGASISAAMGEEIGYCFIEKLDDELEYGKWYSTNTPVFGKTLLRFEYEGIATHAAIYFGQDHSGNTYVFSKNGPFPAPKIMLLQDVENIPGYGTVTPLRTNTKRLQGDSGMYNYGRKKSK